MKIIHDWNGKGVDSEVIHFLQINFCCQVKSLMDVLSNRKEILAPLWE